MHTQIDIELKTGKANLEVFSETLQHMAADDREIIVVTSDSRGSGKLTPFGEKFPNQIVEIGIAEQNLVGVSAGLASTGKKVFAVSPACFLSARSLEQIKNDVAYSDNHVNLVGISAGVSYGALGSTHHSLHDFAALRAINNLIVVAPADNFETMKAIQLASITPHPVYLRFGKRPQPHLPRENDEFVFGKGRILISGDDIALIATGECVPVAYQAAQRLRENSGINACVISMHTIKPLDTNLLSKAAATCKAMITVEEHSIYGGLGEACASFLIQQGYNKPFKILGIPDEYTVTGSQQEIFNHYNLTPDGIFNTAKSLLK